MSRKLEEYIKEHKKAFDTASPSDQLWSRIDAGLNQESIKKPLRVQLWLSIAASLIAIMAITFIYISHKPADNDIEIADINPGYARKEMKFASLIEAKRDSLKVFADKNPQLYAEFSTDLNQLGKNYEALKKELKYSPNQKAVVKAMVKNLELQLQVISQQLSIISEVEEYKAENRI